MVAQMASVIQADAQWLENVLESKADLPAVDVCSEFVIGEIRILPALTACTSQIHVIGRSSYFRVSYSATNEPGTPVPNERRGPVSGTVVSSGPSTRLGG